MPIDTINPSELREEILKIFANEVSSKYVKEISSTNFVVSSDYWIYRFEITDKIIGYDFALKKHILGIDVGIGKDTDLYPIKGEPYSEIALNIFNDGVRLLRALLKESIYCGRKNKNAYLFVQLNNEYLGKIYTKKLFLWNIKSVKVRSLGDYPVKLLDEIVNE